MVSFSLRQRILFTSSVDTRSVSFHLSQFVRISTSMTRLVAELVNMILCGKITGIAAINAINTILTIL